MNLDADSCYAAHRAKDARFDGVFFTAVKSTRIYCRPICRARTPLRDSCEFFSVASAAEASGYRPCLLCRPELSPGRREVSLAASILTFLQLRAVEGVRFAALEEELGLSTRQVRRILQAEYGVGPLEIMQTQRLLLAKQLLHDTQAPVGAVALASGFRSLRAFQAAFLAHYGMVPTQLRKQEKLPHSKITLRLAYRPPLAWQALLDYFQSRLLPSVEEIVGMEYRRTVQLDSATGWIRVWPAEGESVLLVEISPSLVSKLGVVQSRLRQLFDLDASPEVIQASLMGDPLLAPTFVKFPGLRVGGAWDQFELAVRAVLGQQITVAAATTLSARLVQRVGQPVVTPFENLNRLGITPAGVAQLSVDDLCRLGLVSARAETLRQLAKFALEGGLSFPPSTDHAAVVARLIELPGIGPWTAHYIAMRGLRFPDAFPAADLGLRKAIGGGTACSTADAEARSKSWQPWRAYAAAALWKSLSALKCYTHDL